MISQKITVRTALLLLVLINSLCAKAQSENNLIDRLFFKTLNNRIISADSLLLVGRDLISRSQPINYESGLNRGKILAGRGLFLLNQLDSAANYFLDVAQATNDTGPQAFEHALAHNFLGNVFSRLNNHSRAMQEFQIATKIFKSLNNAEYIAVGVSNIGSSYLSQEDFVRALEYLLDAQKVALSPGVSDVQRANILANISIVYNRMEKKHEALKFAFDALALDEKSGNKLGVCQSYNGIGNIYKYHRLYDSAIIFYNKTLLLARGQDAEFDPVALRALQNKADCYTRQNNFKQAISLLRQIQKSKTQYQVDVVYSYLARYYKRTKMYDSAIYFSRMAIKKARESNAKTSLVSSFESMSSSFVAKGKMDSAYHYKALQLAWTDSLYNERNRKNFDNLQVQLATLDKEREVFALKNEAEIKRVEEKLTLVFVVAVFLVITQMLVSVVLFYKNKQKQEQLKSIDLEDKLAKSNADLRNQTLRMIHINNGMQEMEASLKKLKEDSNHGNINQLLKNLNLNQTLEKEWESFNEYFGSIHVGFYERLTAAFPQLTIAEKRLAGLVRMELTNREIAGILRIEDSSVKTAKYRLKKKLNLGDEQDLYAFLTRLHKNENAVG